MFIEYMNYSLSKTPTSIMTEDVYNDPGLNLKLNFIFPPPYIFIYVFIITLH